MEQIMKTLLFIILITFVTEISYAQNRLQISDGKIPECTSEQTESSVLNHFRKYSSFTDPGEYSYLYKDLPDSLPDLCSIIKAQFIHPYADLPNCRDIIPRERWNEFPKYPTVKSILEGLLSYNEAGITTERETKDKLVLICRQNAILLASILKYRGIPARVRAGHAAYIAPGFHVSHTICEVWNEEDKRWMLVDPSMDMVDFSRDQFDFSNELWIQFQNDEIDPNLYGVPRRYTGLISIVGKISTDLASLLGIEYPIYHYAPILDYIKQNNTLTSEHIEVLNRISELMKTIDEDNISRLREIYNSSPVIQITEKVDFSKSPL
jgi:hypothetical protein